MDENTTAGTQLREMWQTRPHRLRDAGKLGGVAAGIAARYDVDPVLVRVAFVVATILGGAGIPVYLACWLVLPAQGDEVSAGESLLGRGSASMSRGRTIVLVVLLAIFSSSLVGNNALGTELFSSGLLGVLLLGAGLYGLHHRRPAPAGAAPAGPGPVSLSKQSTVTPPRWDPLGAAPFAWDLPDPTPAPPPRPPRSRHTPVTLGLALIAVAVAITVRLGTGWDWLHAGRIGAVALTVVGLGLIVGAFRRRGYALLAVAAPLAGFVAIATAAASSAFDGPFPSRDVVVTDAAQLQSTYDGDIGDMTIDLRSLRLPEASEDRDVRVNGGIGDITVLLPAELSVEINCTSGIGEVRCPSGNSGRGGTLTLQVEGGVGDVEVRRG